MEPAPLTRICRECQQPFTTTVEELHFLDEIARREDRPFTAPWRCTPCRAARRRERFAPPVVDDGIDELLPCVDCNGAMFIFGGKDKTFFASRGWTKPKRCRPHRSRHPWTEQERNDGA